MEDSTRPEPSKSRQALHSLAWLIGAVVGVVLIQTFLIKPFVIPSESMTPTLQVGDRIMVGKLRWIWSTPERGQIVVFRPPAGALQGEPHCGGRGGLYTQSICIKAWGGKSDQVFFVKRIVAIGGDRVSLRQGRLWLNGKPAREPYVHSVCLDTIRCTFPQTVQIPQGEVLLLGDNRANSDDGRFWGTIPQEWIVGPMVASWWPLDRLGLGQ